MIEAKELGRYIDKLLQVKKFRDYCPNGLQVEGCAQIRSIVSGVTACQALIDHAKEVNADAILVHHGYFWKGEDECIVGMKAQRIKSLLDAQINLFAYHLPLDAHPELGNNVQLGKQLGLTQRGVLDEDQATPITLWGEVETVLSPQQLKQRIAETLQRDPLWIDGGKEEIRTVGWCTGAAQDYIQYAIGRGIDAFISGEVSERTTHIAREAGIHYFAAGHHATERCGVQALGQHLAQELSLKHSFFEVPNPV
ncbi:MAG: Nif3-like dinuclear metal center hexameric protein [Candidatus Oxydemutatoraceae bacterium WSBS_2016_MAG_OTU14]